MIRFNRIGSLSRFLLFEHDLFRKPVSTFRDHALFTRIPAPRPSNRSRYANRCRGIPARWRAGGRRRRGRLSSTGMIDFTRPGRLVKTTTMSERKIASCRSWVTNSTVRLLRSHIQEQRLQQQAGLAVERAERLVHQQDIRLDGKGAGERAVRRTPTSSFRSCRSRTGRVRGVMSALLPKADIEQASPNVCYVPKSDSLHRGKKVPCYSITSSARPSNDIGTVMPSAFAVLRFRNSSTFVLCCTEIGGLVALENAAA